jgi:protein-tyrosine phosphatase
VTVDRHLDWPNCRNARDLGGLPTADGGFVRAGALIRSDCLQFLSEEGVAAVRSTGVSRIIDLRSHGEVSAFPTPFTQDPIAVHIPLSDPADPRDHDTIVGACIEMLELYPGNFAAALRAIADAPDGAVIVHCFGGKDRTGVLVALALIIAGVPEDEIVADYALTQSRMAGLLAEQLAAEPDEARHSHLIEYHDTRPESLTAILRHLDTKHGGAISYLHQAGLSASDRESLRVRLIG